MIILMLIIAVFAVSALSITISRAKITLPLRDWADANLPWIGKLLGCPYCVSHWLGFVAALLLQTPVFPNYWVNLGFLTFGLTGAAALVTGAAFSLLHMQESYIDLLKQRNEDQRSLIKTMMKTLEDELAAEPVAADADDALEPKPA